MTNKIYKYKCESCGEEKQCDSLWTTKVAMEESKELFGDFPTEDLGEVCDDCFKDFMEWFETVTEERKKEMREKL